MKGSKSMNTIVKKIAAAAMAFSLLGTGASIPKTISTKNNNSYTLTAHAATCKHNGYRYQVSTNWVFERTVYVKNHLIRIDKRTVYIKCGKCNNIISQRTERTYKTIY